MASREVIDTDNSLPKSEQFFEEIRTDESGNAGDDPHLGCVKQMVAEISKRCGDHELSVEEYPPGRVRAVVRGRHARPIIRAAYRGNQRREKASSIPVYTILVLSLSRFPTGG